MLKLVAPVVFVAGCGGQAASGIGGGSESECDYRKPDATSVEVRLTNATDTPVYVATPGGGCEHVPSFTVEAVDGTALVGYVGECTKACSTVLDGGCGCLTCGDSGVIKLFPGGTYADTWSGLLYESGGMPAACAEEAGCAASCLVEVVPEEALIFVGTVHPTADCDRGYCECSPSEEGWCDISAAFEGTGEPMSRKVTWNPGDSVVDIVIE